MRRAGREKKSNKRRYDHKPLESMLIYYPLTLIQLVEFAGSLMRTSPILLCTRCDDICRSWWIQSRSGRWSGLRSAEKRICEKRTSHWVQYLPDQSPSTLPTTLGVFLYSRQSFQNPSTRNCVARCGIRAALKALLQNRITKIWHLNYIVALHSSTFEKYLHTDARKSTRAIAVDKTHGVVMPNPTHVLMSSSS